MFVALGLLVFPQPPRRRRRAGDGARARARLRLAAGRGRGRRRCRCASRGASALVLSGAGLRGAVPVVLATFPVIAGVSGSTRLFDVVFFAVLLSTLIQGVDLRAAGALRWARRRASRRCRVRWPRRGRSGGWGPRCSSTRSPTDDAVVGARVRDLGLPREAVVNVIVRGDEAIPPRGSTILRAGDRLHVLLRSELSRDVHRIVERWRQGPIGPPPRPPRRMEGAPAHLHASRRSARSALDGDAAHPRAVAGDGRGRAAAHPPRRPGLRSSPSTTGATRWSGRWWPSAARQLLMELGDAPAAPAAGRRRRARMAAERRRRAGGRPAGVAVSRGGLRRRAAGGRAGRARSSSSSARKVRSLPSSASRVTRCTDARGPGP